MNRLKNARNGFVIGNINYLLGIIGPFIIRTIMINFLGNEYLGLNSLFTSILQVLSLSELGVGTAISYHLYKPIANHDVERINAILCFYKITYRIIGVAILVISFIVSFFLPSLIKGDVPCDLDIYILFWIYVSNTVVSYFLFAYKKILLSASQHYDKEMMVAIISSLFKYGIQIGALIVFRNYYIYVVVFPVSTILDNLICFFVVRNFFPDYRATGKLEGNEIKKILRDTGGAFCSKIGSTVYSSVDNIVISSFLGLLVLGIYNNYFYVITVFTMFFAVGHNAIRPVIGNYWALESKKQNWNMFRMINTGYMVASSIICSVSIALLQKFEIIWGGQDNFLGFDIVLCLVLNFYISRMTAIPSVYLEATGTLWQGKFVPIISAVFNLILNLALVQVVGLPGIIISSIIAALIVSVPGYLIVLQNNVFKEFEFIKYYVKSNIKCFMQFVILTIVCCYINGVVFKYQTVFSFVLEGIMLVTFSVLVSILLNIRNLDMKALALYFMKKG